MTTTIECTKSELKARLEAEYMSPIDHASRSGLEMMDVINGLVRAANEHRGVFEGHSAYFDLDFIIHPDGRQWPTDAEIATNYKALINVDNPDVTTYVPGPAMRAMVAHLTKRLSDGSTENPLTPTYARFRMLIEGIKAEMPNWTDVQARDWLSAQIRH